MELDVSRCPSLMKMRGDKIGARRRLPSCARQSKHEGKECRVRTNRHLAGISEFALLWTQRGFD